MKIKYTTLDETRVMYEFAKEGCCAPEEVKYSVSGYRNSIPSRKMAKAKKPLVLLYETSREGWEWWHTTGTFYTKERIGRMFDVLLAD